MKTYYKRLATMFASCACGLLIGTPVMAGIGSDLNNFVDELGGAAATSSGNIFKGQGYTYINGGRLFVRTPGRNVQLATLKMPSYKAGCGGIDIFGGGMSFIDSSELVQVLKQVGSNAASYAFMLALRTISSQIANTLEESFEWIQKLNSLNINTCEAAAWAVDGIMSAGEHSKEQSLCIMRRMETSADTYSEAVEACTVAGGNRAGTVNDNTVRERAFVDGNLAWLLMNDSAILSGDNQMRQVLQSITGTLVKRKVVGAAETPGDGNENAQTKMEVHPSLLLVEDTLLDTILYGGTASYYRCQDSMGSKFGCKQIQRSTLTLSAGQSLRNQTADKMNALFNKIRNKQNPTAAEQEFVTTTAFPVYRVLAVAASLRGDVGTDLVNKYVDVAAVDLLFTYVNRLIDSMSGYANDPKYGADGQYFLENLREVQKLLSRRRQEVNEKMESTLRVAEELRYYERLVVSSLPRNIVENYAWSKGGGV